jgi:(4S)-4-hydroxy-5-phosphonooxypentane-2,3-dione isomerase
MYVVIVEFEIVPVHVSAFKSRVLQQARDSLALETDCNVFDVCEDSTASTHILLYEIYSDGAAFEHHLQTPHFKAFDTEVAPWILSKSVRILTRHEIAGQPDEH